MFDNVADKFADSGTFRQDNRFQDVSCAGGVVAGKRTADNGFGVTYHSACPLAAAEQIVFAVGFQSSVDVGKVEITHGVALTAGQGIFKTGPFKAGDHTQFFQWVVGRHQFG